MEPDLLKDAVAEAELEEEEEEEKEVEKKEDKWGRTKMKQTCLMLYFASL